MRRTKISTLKLIETDEIIRAARLKRFGGSSAAKVLMTVLRINRINRLYDEVSHHRGVEFIDALIEKLQLEYEVSDEELKKIPKEGPVITVSNHPFGGIDGMLLVKILTRVRPDLKVMSNFILNKIEPVSEYMFRRFPVLNESNAHELAPIAKETGALVLRSQRSKF